MPRKINNFAGLVLAGTAAVTGGKAVMASENRGNTPLEPAVPAVHYDSGKFLGPSLMAQSLARNPVTGKIDESVEQTILREQGDPLVARIMADPATCVQGQMTVRKTLPGAPGVTINQIEIASAKMCKEKDPTSPYGVDLVPPGSGSPQSVPQDRLAPKPGAQPTHPQSPGVPSVSAPRLET
jgi:hypothetical protein